MQALETLAKNQQVEYDFGVYTLPMPADVPVTILSDGPSLLKASVSLEMPLNAGAAGDCITSAAPQHCSAASTLEVVDSLYMMAVLRNKTPLLPCCK